MKGSTIYKITSDSWNKNHYGNKVKLIYHGDITPCNVGTHRTYRLSVSGGDCMVFDSCIESEVRSMFFVISNMMEIRKTTLLKLGFKMIK